MTNNSAAVNSKSSPFQTTCCLSHTFINIPADCPAVRLTYAWSTRCLRPHRGRASAAAWPEGCPRTDCPASTGCDTDCCNGCGTDCSRRTALVADRTGAARWWERWSWAPTSAACCDAANDLGRWPSRSSSPTPWRRTAASSDDVVSTNERPDAALSLTRRMRELVGLVKLITCCARIMHTRTECWLISLFL